MVTGGWWTVNSGPIGVLLYNSDLLSNLDQFTLFGLSLVLIAITGVAFGIVWMAVNLYHIYPFVRLFIFGKFFPDVSSGGLWVDPVDVSRLDPAELPTIDILLPAYEESDVIHQSIVSLCETNYPRELVSINVLVEPDDHETRSALDSLHERDGFQVVPGPLEFNEIVVPEDYPGEPNKPRALNYGFELTDNDIVGIVDAEDIVDPDLFVHVYSGLVTQNYDYVQGILDMVNEDDGWLNTHFRGEYAWWFRWLLPSFYYVDYPVPLGGTTNFFHRSVLEELSQKRYEEYGDPWNGNRRTWFESRRLAGEIPWDPWNVTEDFELGLFLWKEGYELGLIETVTREESPLSLNQWIKQRTRWQKGKMYSFAQYANHRPEGLTPKFHLLFQSFLPHLASINIAGIVILLMVANILGLGMPIGVAVVLLIGLFFLVEINLLHAFSYWRTSTAGLPTRFFRAGMILLTLQFYWIPLWGAEQRALRQLYSSELHWEKTTHNGRNATVDRSDTVPVSSQASYSPKQVVAGLLVLLLGLFISVVLPLLLLL